MSRSTVVWLPEAEDQLTEIWLAAAVRNAVRDAADRIDRILGMSPENVGVDFYGDRLMVDYPLTIVFKLSPDDRLVTVLDVWSA